MDKRMSQLKEMADKKMSETLCAEEKFMKAINIG